MLEKWRSAVDNKNTFGVLLTDLPKAFDCLSHELLLAKLHAYGFSIPALRLVYSYLQNRKQRTKINSAYSCWEEIIYKVPQVSILGPLLFNIFLCDLFCMMSDTDLLVMLTIIHLMFQLILSMKLLKGSKLALLNCSFGLQITR